MKSVCVFCGSSPGVDPRYAEAARELGQYLAERDIQLVYGGGRVGLMGILADAVLTGGGRALGVIPRSLWDREIGHTGLTDLRVVETMHERKALMAAHADAFIALPGGIGTLEEFFEVWTWGLLGLHEKPYGLYDVAGYYRPLAGVIDHMIDQGFLQERFREMVVVADSLEPLFSGLAAFRPPIVQKWVDLRQT